MKIRLTLIRARCFLYKFILSKIELLVRTFFEPIVKKMTVNGIQLRHIRLYQISGVISTKYNLPLMRIELGKWSFIA